MVRRYAAPARRRAAETREPERFEASRSTTRVYCRPVCPARVSFAVPRLARLAAQRIGAGALNGSSVADLAGELGVSERHLRRALERELGVSPAALAQTHRLLLAKRQFAETSLPVTRGALAGGAIRLLQRAAGVSSRRHLRQTAERWRPWRAYAAQHLWLHDEERL